MWRGAFLSGLAHAALIAAALPLPWLSPGDDTPPPALAVRLFTPADVTALEVAARLRAARASRPPALPAATPEPPAAAPAPEHAPLEAPPPARGVLAPAFDPAAPLGLEDAPAPPRPRARSGTGTGFPEPASSPVAAGTTEAAMLERLERATQAALLRARVDPPGLAARGVVGTARVEITLDRAGRLLLARLSRSSGSAAIDRASLDAALAARLPAAPTDLPGDRFTLAVDLFFGLDGD